MPPGVPQGDIFSSLLFMLFFNSVKKVIFENSLNVCLYDDCRLFQKDLNTLDV